MPLVVGCVADSLGQRRIAAALRDHAELRWHPSFTELRTALECGRGRVIVVVVDQEDPTGASANSFAEVMAESFPGIGVVVYAKSRSGSNSEVCQLGAAGVHDVMISGLTDEGYTARTIILGASRLGAADLVVAELERILPQRLHPFAAAIVRNPSKGSIAKITQHLNVHRQTPNFWCKKERFLRPEELLVWCRMFLASALLELTGRTLDSIASELDYASPTSLRNQLKNYTGMTATQIRQAGLGVIVEVFKGRVAQVQSGFAGREEGSRETEAGRKDVSMMIDARHRKEVEGRP